MPRGLVAARPGRLPANHPPVNGLSFCGGPPGSPLSAPAVGRQACRPQSDPDRRNNHPTPGPTVPRHAQCRGLRTDEETVIGFRG